jgi:hypothetical protein
MKGAAFYGTGRRPTEMWNIEPDSFSVLALRITAAHVQVPFPTKLFTLFQCNMKMLVFQQNNNSQPIHEISIV